MGMLAERLFSYDLSNWQLKEQGWLILEWLTVKERR